MTSRSPSDHDRVEPRQRRVAVVVLAASIAGALWRATVAVRHSLAASAAVDDASARELEQVAALVESGFALILLFHAAAAAFYLRRPFGLSGLSMGAMAGIAAGTVVCALSRIPYLGAPGVVPASLLLAGSLVGRRVRHAWISTYLGVGLGTLAACVSARVSLEPFVLVAVAAPPVACAFAGVGLGRLVRRVGSRARRGSRGPGT